MAITVGVPGRGTIEAVHLVLDLNGTLAADGIVPRGVGDPIRALTAVAQVHILTAEISGTASALEGLGARIVCLGVSDRVAANAAAVPPLGAARTLAIWKGMNGEAMLREAAPGIAVAGREGAAGRTGGWGPR